MTVPMTIDQYDELLRTIGELRESLGILGIGETAVSISPKEALDGCLEEARKLFDKNLLLSKEIYDLRVSRLVLSAPTPWQ